MNVQQQARSLAYWATLSPAERSDRNRALALKRCPIEIAMPEHTGPTCAHCQDGTRWAVFHDGTDWYCADCWKADRR